MEQSVFYKTSQLNKRCFVKKDQDEEDEDDEEEGDSKVSSDLDYNLI